MATLDKNLETPASSSPPTAAKAPSSFFLKKVPVFVKRVPSPNQDESSRVDRAPDKNNSG